MSYTPDREIKVVYFSRIDLSGQNIEYKAGKVSLQVLSIPVGQYKRMIAAICCRHN